MSTESNFSPSDVLLDYPAAARILGVSVSNLRNLVDKGELSTVDVGAYLGNEGGRRRPTLRIAQSEVAEFVGRRTIARKAAS
jgi:helix-turn-helix protein